MKALCENDKEKGPGYGLLSIRDAQLGAKHSFAVQRAGDRKFLGLTGWQDTEERLSPLTENVNADVLTIEVGPQVVDRLDPLENYRVILYGLGAPQATILELGALSYSGVGASGAVGQANFTKKEAAPKPAPVEAPPPVEPCSVPEPAAIAAPVPVQEELQMAAATSKKTSPLLLALLVLLLLAFAGAAGWWFFLRDTAQTPPVAEETAQTPKEPATEEPTTEESAQDVAANKEGEADGAIDAVGEGNAENPDPTTTQTPAPEQAAPAIVKRPAKAFVTEFMVAKGPAKDALAMANGLLANPEVSDPDSAEAQDARFILLEYAAEGGEAEAMYALAQIYDPKLPQYGTIIKDETQATLWYNKAKAAGYKP